MSSKQPIFWLACLAFILFGLSSLNVQAQQATPGEYPFSSAGATRLAAETLSDTPPVLRPGPALIIRNFTAAELKFRQTMIHFSFRRDVVLQTIGLHGEVTGEYIRNSVFVLDDHGQRVERVLYHPQPTMKEMIITKEDIQDLAGSQLFGLETTDAADYNFSYVREESLNGRPAYVVAVSPKQEPDPRRMRSRFFVGQVWIDQATFQAIQLRGVTEPHGKQRFPVFETARDIKIGNLSFPSSTSADDVLRFTHKEVRFRIKVRYYDFKRFAGRVKILELE